MVSVHAGVGAVAPVRDNPLIRSDASLWTRGVIVLLTRVVLVDVTDRYFRLFCHEPGPAVVNVWSNSPQRRPQLVR
jgi:hypothetical protein